MTQAAGSSWKDAEVARRFLDERRRAIPLGDEQVTILLRMARHFVPQPGRVADLGCGDGFLARAVLSEFPTAHALLIDHSEPMLRRAHEAMAPFSGRFEIRHGDLSDPLPPQIGGPFDLIVSGYAIHHLPTARKRALYEEVFGLLAPGGLFVNAEHVASATPELEAVFDGAYIDHNVAVTGRETGQGRGGIPRPPRQGRQPPRSRRGPGGMAAGGRLRARRLLLQVAGTGRLRRRQADRTAPIAPVMEVATA